ncbi:hypothetical protein E2C01_050355 [Portunus trituberculatus]|uniref:Uncharacterized protein n=1 Tax=Portunus trituberculatus TaxID=210409 RepID=A0A5B7GG71_PORTR|nr:hypothetical protein [Portunus trituberculatus]
MQEPESAPLPPPPPSPTLCQLLLRPSLSPPPNSRVVHPSPARGCLHHLQDSPSLPQQGAKDASRLCNESRACCECLPGGRPGGVCGEVWRGTTDVVVVMVAARQSSVASATHPRGPSLPRDLSPPPPWSPQDIISPPFIICSFSKLLHPCSAVGAWWYSLLIAGHWNEQHRLRVEVFRLSGLNEQETVPGRPVEAPTRSGEPDPASIKWYLLCSRGAAPHAAFALFLLRRPPRQHSAGRQAFASPVLRH